MRREIAMFAAAFAVLALAAGSAAAQNFTAGATVGTLQPLDAADNVTVEQCEAAWAASPAYGQCGNRLAVEGPAQPESVTALANLCVIKTSCEYYAAQKTEYEAIARLVRSRRDTNWNGGLNNTSQLKNCEGNLMQTCL